MTPPEAKKYLFDMQQAAKPVAQFTASLTLHVLVHGYDRIRDEIVWGIIQNDLTQLQTDVEALLK